MLSPCLKELRTGCSFSTIQYVFRDAGWDTMDMSHRARLRGGQSCWCPGHRQKRLAPFACSGPEKSVWSSWKPGVGSAALDAVSGWCVHSTGVSRRTSKFSRHSLEKVPRDCPSLLRGFSQIPSLDAKRRQERRPVPPGESVRVCPTALLRGLSEDGSLPA